MRKRFKWKLVAFFAVISALFLLGGCKFQESLDEKKDKYNVHASVTYNANGGVFDGTSHVEKTLYLPAGSVAMNINTDDITNGKGTITDVVRTNYTLIGWYEAQLDENGEAQKTESGEVILKDTPYDFSKDNVLKNGDDIFLYAKWQKDESVYVYLLCEDIVKSTEFTLSDKSKVSVTNEGLLTDYGYDKNGACNKPSTAMIPTASGYTFFEFYADKACTEKISWPIKQEEKGDYNIYAKYLEGDWIILRTKEEIKDKLFNAANRQFYLANDIDCTGLTGVKALSTFTCTLQGNGYTISNLTVNADEKVKNGNPLSIFGILKEKASIENVTFENWTLKYKFKTSAFIFAYVFFNEIENISSVKDLILKGTVSMNIERPDGAIISNLMGDNDTWQTTYTHVLFGGDLNDQKQITNGLDVDVSNATINVVMDNDKIVL